MEQQTWDIFISYASEQREAVVLSLANALKQLGLNIWLDQTELKLGDRKRRDITRGIKNSNYGILVLSHEYFKKDWPQSELEAFDARERIEGKKLILPIWYEITEKEINQYDPILTDRIAVQWSEGLEKVLKKVLEVAKPDFKFSFTSHGLGKISGNDEEWLKKIETHVENVKGRIEQDKLLESARAESCNELIFPYYEKVLIELEKNIEALQARCPIKNEKYQPLPKTLIKPSNHSHAYENIILSKIEFPSGRKWGLHIVLGQASSTGLRFPQLGILLGEKERTDFPSFNYLQLHMQMYPNGEIHFTLHSASNYIEKTIANKDLPLEEFNNTLDTTLKFLFEYELAQS